MTNYLNSISKEEMEYLSNGTYNKDFDDLQEKMKTTFFSLNDLGVSPREAAYWAKKDILPDFVGSGGVRKYNLKQSIWIKLVQQLRSIGVSLSLISKMKSSLLIPDISISEVLENKKLMSVFNKILEQEGKTEQFQELLKDSEFQREFRESKIDAFECVILYTIIFRHPMSYIVTEDGSCITYNHLKHQDFQNEVPEFDLLMQMPHIIVSVSSAYAELVKDWCVSKYFNDISLVMKKEKKILSYLRDESIVSMEIFKEGNEPTRMKYTKKVKANAVSDFADLIAKCGYQKITVQTRNGKTVDFKNEYSIKL